VETVETVMTETLLVTPPLEAVILAVPALTGVTTPLEFTVATDLLFELHVKAAEIGLLF